MRSTKGKLNGNWRHGLDGTKINKIYYAMMSRCRNKNSKNFIRYGGRGIKCEWKSFIDFKNDMYESYIAHIKEFGEKNTSIDRIDNNGNYSKENCKWSTWEEQRENRRNTLLITFNGKTKTLKKWAEEKNMGYMKLFHRIKTLKWTLEKSLNNP